MTIRAVLFDLDGTLVDSLHDLADAVNHVRSVFSCQPLTMDAVRAKVGKGARNLLQQALPDATDTDIDRALNLFIHYNRQHIADKTRLYPGMLETLHQLAAHSIKLAVITNKNEDLSRLLLQTLGVDDLFETICGGDTYPDKKPSPLPLLKVAEKMGSHVHECVMVGDSINDIEAGQRAGIASIGCTWGYGIIDELAGAQKRVHSPQELYAAISADLR